MAIEKELGQEEIDALFQAARTRSEAAPEAPRSRVLPWSFSRSGQISNEQLRAISMLNDIFARNLTHHLSAWFRSRVQVSLVSAEQIQFSEFLLRIPELAYVCSVRLDPLRATSVLQMDLTTAPSMIDLLLGGDGESPEARELTDIEEAILSGETSGLLNLAFPAVASNTILRRLAGEKARHRRHSEETRGRMRELAGSARTRASLHLPTVRVAAGELGGLRPGSVLRFDLTARTPAQFRAGGLALFSAAPVGRADHRAAEILTPCEARP